MSVTKDQIPHGFAHSYILKNFKEQESKEKASNLLIQFPTISDLFVYLLAYSLVHLFILKSQSGVIYESMRAWITGRGKKDE